MARRNSKGTRLREQSLDLVMEMRAAETAVIDEAMRLQPQWEVVVRLLELRAALKAVDAEIDEAESQIAPLPGASRLVATERKL